MKCYNVRNAFYFILKNPSGNFKMKKFSSAVSSVKEVLNERSKVNF